MTTNSFHTNLADGREIIYFDRAPGVDRGAVDQRDLPEARTTAQIRWNPLFRDYVGIASHRQDRTYKPPADLCPLCPSRDGKHTRYRPTTTRSSCSRTASRPSR